MFFPDPDPVTLFDRILYLGLKSQRMASRGVLVGKDQPFQVVSMTWEKSRARQVSKSSWH